MQIHILLGVGYLRQTSKIGKSVKKQSAGVLQFLAKQEQKMDFIRANRSLFIFEGMFFVLLGILGIAVPVLYTFVLKCLVGWLFVIGA